MFARYTYGKPVQGSVKAVVCRRHIRYNRKSSKAKRSVCKDYTGEVSTWDIPSSCKREERSKEREEYQRKEWGRHQLLKQRTLCSEMVD